MHGPCAGGGLENLTILFLPYLPPGSLAGHNETLKNHIQLSGEEREGRNVFDKWQRGQPEVGFSSLLYTPRRDDGKRRVMTGDKVDRECGLFTAVNQAPRCAGMQSIG